eukprot:s1739_g17.t1
MDDVFFEAYVEAHVLPGEAPIEELRSRSRSRSKAIHVSERGGSLETTVQYTDGTSTALDVESGAHDVESSEVEPLQQELPEEEPVLHEEPQPSRPAPVQPLAQVQQPAQQQGQASQSGGDRRLQALQALSLAGAGGDPRLQALQALRDQRAQGLPPRLPPPPLPLRASSSPSSDNMSEVTDRDQVVEQRILRYDQREIDPPVVMYTNEDGDQQPLDPLQSVLFYLEDQNGDRTFLERHDGWKNRLPTPNHLRTIPRVPLTRRRWIYATLVNNRMETVSDDWVANPHRVLGQPWFGTVVFFQGQGQPQGQGAPSDDEGGPGDDEPEDQDDRSPRSAIIFEPSCNYEQNYDLKPEELYAAVIRTGLAALCECREKGECADF